MTAEASVKLPQCYKMLVNSLVDWSQWLQVITKFGKNPYLFGLLDKCTMGDDSPTVTLWSFSPVNVDSGDVYLSNDITNTPGATIAPAVNHYYYNTPSLNMLTKSCLF